MKHRFFIFLAALPFACSTALVASDHTASLHAALSHERDVQQWVLADRPIVETYLQYTAKGQALPNADAYSVAEVAKTARLNTDAYRSRSSKVHWSNWMTISAITGFGPHQEVVVPAFADMVAPDLEHFNERYYRFAFVRSEFLGSRKMDVFDCQPLARGRRSKGRFVGRFWVDQQTGVIARFIGVFRGSKNEFEPEYLHFDSWRKEVSPGHWIPDEIYFEDSVHTQVIHGQLRFWGYDLLHKAAPADPTLADLQVEGADDQSKSDVGPLEARQLWRQQAVDNVLGRLTDAGVLAPPSDFDKVLNQIAVNLEVPNNIDVQVNCRILLTSPVEAASIDRTILLSKGFIDTIPSPEVLASVIALELAHIELGQSVDTKFAFGDNLQFANDAVLRRLKVGRSERENREAAELARKILQNSMYKSDLGNIAAYYAVLVDSEKRLPNLTHPLLGDALFDKMGAPWIAASLPVVNLQTVYRSPDLAPLPLASSLAVDPVSSSVKLIARELPKNQADIYPFQVLPARIHYQKESAQ